MQDQFQNLQIKTKVFLQTAAKINKESTIFLSLLSESVERLTAMAEVMESGICPLPNTQEISCALNLLCDHPTSNEIRILIVSERGPYSLLEQSFFMTFLSTLLQSDFDRRGSIHITFVAQDAIQFALSAKVFQIAKELERTGTKIELWEIEKEKQKTCIEQIIFYEDCNPFCVLTMHCAAEDKDTGFTLSTDGVVLNSAVAGNKASSSLATCLQMLKI